MIEPSDMERSEWPECTAAYVEALEAKIARLTSRGIEDMKHRIAELEQAQRWIPVDDRLPDEGVEVYVWVEDTADDESFESVDYIEEGSWCYHNSNYEHFMAVGGASAGGDDCICTGPSEDAPYTHWRVKPGRPMASNS